MELARGLHPPCYNRRLMNPSWKSRRLRFVGPIRRQAASVMAAVAVLAASLACQIDIGGPAQPGPPIPASTEIAGQVALSWKSAVDTAGPGGEVSVTLDESQITSFLASRLTRAEQPLIREAQAYLRDGLIQIFGVTQQGPLTASVLFAVSPSVTPEGEINIEVLSIDLGPLPAPQALKDSLSAILTEAFSGTLGPLATGLRVTAINVAEGHITITGKLR